jgi:catechol 2,3-dioxygenase-like lactoylglutathione lyase family enzyme
LVKLAYLTIVAINDNFSNYYFRHKNILLIKKGVFMTIVRYLVHDVAIGVAFYVKQLDFTLVEQYGPAMAIVEKDGLSLWLAGPMSSAAKPMLNGFVPTPGGWNRFALEVKNINELVRKLGNAGVVFRNEIVSGPGGQQILCEDPSGNVIELFQKNEA